MSKCTLHLEDEAFGRALKLAVESTKDGKTFEIKYRRDGGRIFYPIGKNVTNTKAGMAIAKRRAKAINEAFESAKYGASAIVNNGYVDGVGIDIDISQRYLNNLLEENEKVEEMKQAMEIQQEDANRLGVNFDDRYAYDEMPSRASMPVSPEAYNYGSYLNGKVEIRNYLNHRKKVLSQMHKTEDTSGTRKEAFLLGQVAKTESGILLKIGRDIEELKRGENVLGNFFDYFHADLKAVKEIIQNPTLENLVVAEKYMDNIKRMLETELIKDGRFLLEGLENLPQEVQDMYWKAKEDFSKTNAHFKTISEKVSARMLDEAKEGTTSLDEKAQIEELRKMLSQEDSKLLSYLLLPIDEDGKNAPPIQMLIRKIFDDSQAKKETISIQTELLDIKGDLEKKLPKKKGANILGAFFTDANYDIFKRITGAGNSRLVNKFSLSWESVKNKANIALSIIEREDAKKESEKTATDKADIENRRKGLFDTLQREKVNFIDIRKLPIFASSPQVIQSLVRLEVLLGYSSAELVNNFSQDAQEVIDYEKELIQSLVTEGGTIASAQREYDRITQEQLEKFQDFETDMEAKVKYQLQEEGVSSYAELPQGRKIYLDNYYSLKSPLAFIKRYTARGDSKVPKTENQAEIDQYHSLDYVSYLPSKSTHFDEDFNSEIESDPTIYRAWELFSDGLSFINENRKYSPSDQNNSDFVDSIIDVSKEHKLEIAANGSTMRSNFSLLGDKIGAFMDTISKALKLNTSKDSGEVSLRGSIRSIDESVKVITKPLYARLSARGIPLGIMLSPKNGISDTLRNIIGEQVRLTPITEPITLKKYIENSIREDIFKSQDNNMISSVVSQMEVVQTFKAKKEVETKLNYFKNLVKNANTDTNPVKRHKQIQLIENFIDRHLYGINNRASGKTITKTYSKTERTYRNMLSQAIEELNGLLPSIIDPVRKGKVANDIVSLEKSMENTGSIITGGSIAETLFIRAKIVAGLGYNIPSQIMNVAIGNMAGRQNDGLEWSTGNYAKSHSYERTRKRVKILNTSTTNDNHDLTDTLISSLGVFQNAANEIEQVINSNSLRKQNLLRKASPLYIIEKTEESIQRPQILAMLGDVYIEANGKKVPVFDVNNHADAHPAFFLENGVIKLKPEFDTPENRDTWITRSSPEYAGLFGLSGKIPQIIARINGDYRETSTVAAKETIAGAMIMTFKTWFPAYIQRRYGKEHGTLTNLAKGGHGADARTALFVKGSLYAGIVSGHMMFNPAVGILGAMAAMGVANIKNSMSEDVTLLQATVASFKNLFTINNFGMTAMKFATIPVGGVLKLAQKTAQMVTPGGKTVIPNSFIDKVIGMRQTADETDLEFEKNKARMQFLLAEIANTMQMLLFKTIALAFLAPDDEEDKEYKDSTFLEKMNNHRNTMMYYMVETMTSRFASDVNLDVDFMNLAMLPTTDALEDLSKLIEDTGKTITGDARIQSGPNKGKLRVGKDLADWVIPKGVRELIYLETPSLGFSTYTQKDWTPNDFIEDLMGAKSDYKHFDKIIREERTSMREKLLEQYMAQYPNYSEEVLKKEVDKLVRAKHPSIKAYFKKSGKMHPGARGLLRRYDSERVDNY